jgi:ADP-ribose pyrophosphatase
MFNGRIIQVDIETTIFPNGSTIDLEIVRHPGGAAVVALDDQNRVCLLHQYRPVVRGWLWELPAGKIDHQEPPLQTARRELAEEAGISAGTWIPLGKMISSPGVFTEVVHLYLARDLKPVPQNREEHEILEVHWLSFQEALAWAHSGKIVDAKTLIALFRAKDLINTDLP